MIGRPLAVIQVPDRRLLSRQEAARYLGMSAHTLDDRVRTGRVRAYRDGGKLKFRLEDLDRYIEDLRVYNPGEEEVTDGNQDLEPGRDTAAVSVETLARWPAFPAVDAQSGGRKKARRADHGGDPDGRVGETAGRAGRSTGRSHRG